MDAVIRGDDNSSSNDSKRAGKNRQLNKSNLFFAARSMILSRTDVIDILHDWTSDEKVLIEGHFSLTARSLPKIIFT